MSTVTLPKLSRSKNERLRQLGRRVKLDKDSLKSFANHLASDDEVVLEATGNTFAIVRLLRPKG